MNSSIKTNLIRKGSLKIASLFLLILSAVPSTPLLGAAESGKAIYYWISHGPPSNPTWTYFLQGAVQWAKDTGNEVRTSFHSGDVPSQQEAIRAAIPVKAKGIVPTLPDPGSLPKIIADAHPAGIPFILIHTDDNTSGRQVYVLHDLSLIQRSCAH